MHSEFSLQLLVDSVGPLDRTCGMIVAYHELLNRPSYVVQTVKMIRLQQLPLQNTEHSIRPVETACYNSHSMIVHTKRRHP
jgi:hypothetical protein